MDDKTFYNLLAKRPGYEAVHLLLQSDQRRQDIVDYVETSSDISGGTVQRWLEAAQREGLVSAKLCTENGKHQVLYSLNIDLSTELQEVIHKRGEKGGRDPDPGHADVANFSHWSDDYSIDSIGIRT